MTEVTPIIISVGGVVLTIVGWLGNRMFVKLDERIETLVVEVHALRAEITKMATAQAVSEARSANQIDGLSEVKRELHSVKKKTEEHEKAIIELKATR